MDALGCSQSVSTDDFVGLLVRCERRVRAFIATLHPHSDDIEEIVQESCMVAWKKLQDFRYVGASPDEEFVRWMCMIARLEVNNARRKRGSSKLLFDNSLLDELAEECLADASRRERRHEALLECVQRLRPRDREMVRRRYQGGTSARELAAFAGRTVDAIYKSLARIRGNLLHCVERTLRDEGASPCQR